MTTIDGGPDYRPDDAPVSTAGDDPWLDQLTAVRTELARVREQRDRAIDLADGIVRHAEDPGLTSGVLADMRRDVDRLRRVIAGHAEDAPVTVVRLMTTPDVVLRHALELTDERDGESRWQRQARGLDEIGYRVVLKAGEARG